MDGGRSPLDESLRAVKRCRAAVPRIAVFDDDLRDALRGGWGDSTEPGFVSGKSGLDRNVRFGVVGATAHFQVGFDSSAIRPSPMGGIRRKRSTTFRVTTTSRSSTSSVRRHPKA